jgi:transcriptional regulator with XRE-family HTH domain
MRLTDYLDSKNISKAQFSRLIGISPMHLSNICNRRRNPSVPLIKRIQKYTDGEVSMDDLFNPEVPSRLKTKDPDMNKLKKVQRGR